MAATLLPASLQNSLQEIAARANKSSAGIQIILLSTSEGVPLGRVYASNDPLNEDVLASIESVWATASKQFPVLGLKKLKQVTAIYDHGTLVHVYQSPVVRKRKNKRLFSIGNGFHVKSLISFFFHPLGCHFAMQCSIQSRGRENYRRSPFKASSRATLHNTRRKSHWA
jgi:hypothetical protein